MSLAVRRCLLCCVSERELERSLLSSRQHQLQQEQHRLQQEAQALSARMAVSLSLVLFL